MKALIQFAEYMYENDIHFLDKCDENEYVNDYVYVDYYVTDMGHVFMDAEFTNDVPEQHDTMFAMNVSDIVDHRVELLKELEKIYNSSYINS